MGMCRRPQRPPETSWRSLRSAREFTKSFPHRNWPPGPGGVREGFAPNRITVLERVDPRLLKLRVAFRRLTHVDQKPKGQSLTLMLPLGPWGRGWSTPTPRSLLE